MSEFRKKVLGIVKAIPTSRVASYGQVALYAGFPRGARQVGWVLKNCESRFKLPWWRVINREGRITIKGNKIFTAFDQKMYLRAEGVNVNENLTVDMNRYRWNPSIQEVEKFQLDDEYVKMLIEKLDL